MPGTTDTKKAKVPLGSFIMNYGSSKMYPQLESLAKMFSADKADMSKSQNVILTNGEIYFPPDAVDEIGVEKLEYMNNKTKESGHSAIDSLIQKATLSNMKMMYGGGMVQPNYAGGGMIEDEMQGYQSGGKVMDYITDLLAVGTGGGIGGLMAKRALAKRNSGDIKSDMPLVEEQIDAPMIDMEAVLNRKKAQDNAAFSMIPTVGEFKGQRIYQGSPEMSSYLDSDAHSQYIKSKFNFQQGGLINYQDGGMIGPPVPPEMMGQAMNQQLGDSIDMRMANPQVGGALGVMRQESEEIEAAMKDNIARNARLALQKMKLDSIMKMKPQERYIPDSLITNPQSLDIRDYEGVPSSNDFLRLFQNMDQSKGVRIPRPSTLR